MPPWENVEKYLPCAGTTVGAVQDGESICPGHGESAAAGAGFLSVQFYILMDSIILQDQYQKDDFHDKLSEFQLYFLIFCKQCGKAYTVAHG